MGRKDKPFHILVIRLSAMGDVAMTVPLINGLIEKYPELQITVLTKKPFASIFAGIERTQVHVANIKKEHKGFPGLWRLYQQLKKKDIHAVADLHNVLRSNILKKYFSFTKIPFAQIDKGRKEKKVLTRLKHKEISQLKTTQNRYAEVFSEIGLPLKLNEFRAMPRFIMPQKLLWMMGQDTRKLIGIAPFAAHKGKMYPMESMREVIRQFDNTDKYKIILFGGGDTEKAKLEEISTAYPNTLNLAGKLSLEEELKVISNLDIMISMDSGNAHLAANFAIPVVTLWGVTHPYAGFYPFNQPPDNALLSDREKYPLIPTSVYGNKVPKGYEHVMESILPDTVYSKVLDILETD